MAGTIDCAMGGPARYPSEKWEMVMRVLIAAVVCSGLAADAAPAFAADLYAQLFPLTGEIRLLNRDVTPVPFAFYSISSDGGALHGSNGVWTSISDNYDLSGNGFIDPDNEWFELSEDAMELAEGVFSGPGGMLPPMRAISLGLIWDPQAVPFPDLVFDIREPNEQPVGVTIELALDGDYSSDQVVDQGDYLIWRKYLESITVLLADGNLNGIVDADDYVVWRSNFGLTLPLPPYGLGSGARSPSLTAGTIPEPTTAALWMLALGGLPFAAQSIARQRRRD